MVNPATIIKGMGTAVAILGGAAEVARALKDAGAAAKPLVPDVNMGELEAKGKAVADKGADAFGGALDALGEKKDAIVQWFTEMQAEKKEKEALREIRQVTLENAHTVIEADDLLKKIKDGAMPPLATMPGVFVVALYSAIELDKDLTDYLGIFVGKGNNLAEDIPIALSKAGNPDVYADVKYEKNVHIYAFNCTLEEVEESYNNLCEIFGDDERCYN